MDEVVARSPAARVAKWLVEKGRAPEAVALLSVRAATGNNDKESHELLAEALRIDPASPLAKLAFERMEGIQAGDHEPLEAAIRQWTNEEVARLEREIAKPAFRRAQIGFNNNVKYKGLVFQIQTEDSGLDKPHIITHLSADGGRVIKSHKRSYAAEVSRDDVAAYVRAQFPAARAGRVTSILAPTGRGVIRVTKDMAMPEGAIGGQSRCRPAGGAKIDQLLSFTPLSTAIRYCWKTWRKRKAIRGPLPSKAMFWSWGKLCLITR